MCRCYKVDPNKSIRLTPQCICRCKRQCVWMLLSMQDTTVFLHPSTNVLFVLHRIQHKRSPAIPMQSQVQSPASSSRARCGNQDRDHPVTLVAFDRWFAGGPDVVLIAIAEPGGRTNKSYKSFLFKHQQPRREPSPFPRPPPPILWHA